MYHPWDELRKLAHITLFWANLPDTRPAETDGTHRIWMSRILDQFERRCVLTHELVHIEWGHTGRVSPAMEAKVCAEAARRLIPLQALIRVRFWARSHDEAAEDLWVTPQVLQDRLTNLTPAEQSAIAKEAPEWHA